MKISIITSPFGCLPPNGIGAVEKLWYDLGVNFADKNHDVVFYAKKNSSEIKYFSDFNVIEELGYKRSGSLLIDLIKDFYFSFKVLRKMTNTDIIVFNTFWSPLLSFFFKKKFKVSVYNVARFPKRQFKFYKHLDRLSCVSLAVYKELLNQTPTVKDIAKVISNPVNTNVFSKNKHIKKDKNRIIYTGRVHPEKGLNLLIEAINKLVLVYPSLQLVVIGAREVVDGGGGATYIDRLNNLATNFKIEWVDPIYNPELLKKEIEQSGVYCYPSVAEKGETFGVAPLEAMATGTATIVSNLECFNDFVKNEINALVFDHRSKNAVELLKQKIELLYKDDYLRSRLELESAKTALNFTNEKIADLYLEDFQSLLSNKER